MTAIEILYIGFGIIAASVGIIFYRLTELDKLFYSWRDHMLKHDKYFTDIEWKRVDDLGKLAALEQRVRTLEGQFEAQAAELTEHHNKIDTLEINGGIYEGLFEQQGLWGEDKS